MTGAEGAGGDRPRLLVLTSTFPRWPDDTTPPFVLDLCRHLAGEFNVHVLAPHARGASAAEILGNVHVQRFRYLPSAWETLAYDGGIPARLRRSPLALLQVPFFVAGQFLSALCLAAKLQPRVIHAHWVLPQGLVAVLLRTLIASRPAVLCTAHGSDLFALNSRASRWLLGRVLRYVDLLTVVGGAMAQRARALGVAPERVQVAPMGVDTDGVFRAGESARDGKRIVFAGRLIPGKGVRVLLDAMPGVLQQEPAARLVIVGDGPDRAALERQARDLRIDAHVAFTGALRQEEVAAHFRTATAAAFPFIASGQDEQEGLGLVVVEAQACGCPVVVSAVPATAGTVVPEVTGLVVAPGDVGALVGALNRLLGTPDLGRRLADAARQSVRNNFDWKTVSARYSAILGSLISPG